jgi:Transposase, Mutator family
MTDVTEDQDRAGRELPAADEQLVRELTGRARAGGLRLTGGGGLPGKLTEMVIEGALEGELDDRLGDARHDPGGRDGGHSRNGHRATTVLAGTGPAEMSVPRDRDPGFPPEIAARRQRRLTGVDDMVMSLPARGLTHRGRSARICSGCPARRSRSRRSRRLPTRRAHGRHRPGRGTPSRRARRGAAPRPGRVNKLTARNRCCLSGRKHMSAKL